MAVLYSSGNLDNIKIYEQAQEIALPHCTRVPSKNALIPIIVECRYRNFSTAQHKLAPPPGLSLDSAVLHYLGRYTGDGNVPKFPTRLL
jgi:hypothetical protein